MVLGWCYPHVTWCKMVLMWWECGGMGVEVWCTCDNSKSMKPENRMVLMWWKCGEKVWKSVESVEGALVRAS